MNKDIEALIVDARSALDGAVIIGAADAPRFELFHAANSICSQKVRTVLAHHGIGYLSQSMNIFAGQTYLPAHVRLRMIGCERLGLPLVTAHRGSTSVATGGCDPAVVPTLIDWQTDDILVDSKRICLYLDGLVPETERLRPPGLAAAIDAELVIVDNLPNYQMLVGRPPQGDQGAAHRPGGGGVKFAMDKVGRCDRFLAEHAGDPVLTRAYTAKRAKELGAAEGLFTEAAMQAAYATADSACTRLDATLNAAPWLFGEAITMADLYWAVELLRMKNVGAASIWENGRLPAVAAFLAAAEYVPSIRAAVLDWPGALY